MFAFEKNEIESVKKYEHFKYNNVYQDDLNLVTVYLKKFAVISLVHQSLSTFIYVDSDIENMYHVF